MEKGVLITGATGFVGSNLARCPLADGHEVHLAIRRGYRSWRIGGLEGAYVHEVALVKSDEVNAVAGKSGHNGFFISRCTAPTASRRIGARWWEPT